jgi:hypothetical protein
VTLVLAWALGLASGWKTTELPIPEYCVELLLDGGTPHSSEAGADGVIDLWVDGVEIGPWDDLWMRTTADLSISILWLNLFHHGDHSAAGVRYDNVVVSTARVGCR